MFNPDNKNTAVTPQMIGSPSAAIGAAAGTLMGQDKPEQYDVNGTSDATPSTGKGRDKSIFERVLNAFPPVAIGRAIGERLVGSDEEI